MRRGTARHARTLSATSVHPARRKLSYVGDVVGVDGVRPSRPQGGGDLATMIRAVQRDMGEDVTEGRSKCDALTVAIFDEAVELIGGPVGDKDSERRGVIRRVALNAIDRPVRPDGDPRGVFTANSLQPDSLGGNHVGEQSSDFDVSLQRGCVADLGDDARVGPAQMLEMGLQQ